MIGCVFLTIEEVKRAMQAASQAPSAHSPMRSQPHYSSNSFDGANEANVAFFDQIMALALSKGRPNDTYLSGKARFSPDISSFIR